MPLFNWFRKKSGKPLHRWDPSVELLEWGPRDVLTIDASGCGFLCLGRSGAGKSSAFGRAIALAQLRAGFSGLVLSVKREADTWTQYCKEANRLDDLCIVDASCKYRFNFLEDLAREQGSDSGLVENVVSLFTDVATIASKQSGQQNTQGDNDFFRQASKVLMRNIVDLLILADQPVSVANMCRVVSSLPNSNEQVASDSWRKSSYCFQLLEIADQKEKSPRQQRDYVAILDYVCKQFVQLADRTKSSVVATYMGMADLWQRGLLYDLHSTDTNLSPRDILNGAIIRSGKPFNATGRNWMRATFSQK